MLERKEIFEKYILLKILDKNKWGKSVAADELGITRQALDVKIKKHGLNKNSPIPDPKEFLLEEIRPRDEIFISQTFSITERDLDFLKSLATDLKKESFRHISLSELIRYAIRLLAEMTPDEISSNL